MNALNRRWIAYYAHCVKATPGKLDREPWYAYESRAVVLESRQVPSVSEEGDYETKVSTEDGKVWETEITEHDAAQLVIYALMSDSRVAAERRQLAAAKGKQ